MKNEKDHNGELEHGGSQADKLSDESKAPSSANPFDPRNLRLSQDFVETLGVKKEIISIAVRKPAKTWWCRVRSGEDFRLQTLLLELQEENETYLLDPKLWPILAAESVVRPFLLILSVTRQDVLFLWKTRLPGPDGKSNQWWDTGLEAIGRAEKDWVRVSANMAAGGYDVFSPISQFPEPTWPEISLEEVLKIAFRGKYIDDPDHQVLKELRGES